MKISIYGAGYVGIVSAVCFAELGHDVCCIDLDQNKITELNQGELPIYEEGLPELLKKNLLGNRIHFTTDPEVGVAFSKLQIIAVGTPSNADGSVNMEYVLKVAKTIGSLMNHYSVIVTKSTVPVGTADRLTSVVSRELKERSEHVDFDVVSNPEFLREGAAVADFMSPDRIIIGTEQKRAIELMRILYGPLTVQGKPFLVMDSHSAEFSKYAANAFLATKISFMNEMSQFAELLGADIELVKKVLGSDKRISDKFLNPGCGFGGSCFPKDTHALKACADDIKHPAYIINAVLATNEAQKRRLFDKIEAFFDNNLNNRVVALWGLAFKPGTDDVRSSPSRTLMELLWQAGAVVQAYDPLAMKNMADIYRESKQLTLCQNAQAALQGADVLAIVTEWDEFRYVDFQHIKQELTYPAIFDGRNIYDPSAIKRLGFDYFPIGRGLPSLSRVRHEERETCITE